MDVVNSNAAKINKHTFDIQGSASIVPGVQATLDCLAADQASLMPTTVLVAEIPTNPDMKVPDLAALVTSLKAYVNSAVFFFFFSCCFLCAVCRFLLLLSAPRCLRRLTQSALLLVIRLVMIFRPPHHDLSSASSISGTKPLPGRK
jgi:hypothetical protein